MTNRGRGAVLAVTLAAAVLAGVVPTHAAERISERVELATFGSPGLPRATYAATGINGLVGWVFPVTAIGRTFSLATEQAPTGVEDFDVAFYASLDSTTPIASFSSDGGESGVVPAGAGWGVVTLSAGAGGTFLYTAA